MSDPVQLSIDDAKALVYQALIACKTSASNAQTTARALLAAEVDGQAGHGLSRAPAYAGQARSGKVNGMAEPILEQVAAASLVVDAGYGFSYPAIDLAITELPGLAKNSGIAAAYIRHGHHFGQAGAHAERLAEQGLVALVFGNSPKAIAFWGSSKPMMGTNPIACAAPVAGRAPLVIDLAVAQAARGKIVNAQREGRESIPEGWALDVHGQPTTDPKRALEGSMAPIGGAKGAALAMLVEILAAALTGCHFGFEASSLFTTDGEPPNLGHTLIAIDPATSSGRHFAERMKTLVATVANEPDTRLPGESRLQHREQAKTQGVSISQRLYQDILSLSEP